MKILGKIGNSIMLIGIGISIGVNLIAAIEVAGELAYPESISGMIRDVATRIRGH